jgi:metal-responsive CopG/Arc/MetJ family transcriptional regulator
MKTAISISDDLFKTVEELADELNISRSQVFTEAVRDYIEKYRSEKILQAVNAAYSAKETEQETKLRRQSKKRYVKLLRHEKW